jgi:hypothetical protein
VEKYRRAGQVTDDNTAHAHCMLDTEGYARTHTYTYTHSEYVIVIAFPLQQRLHERASMLRYTYVCLLYMIIIKNYYIYFISVELSTDSVNVKLVSCNLKVSHLLHVGM